MTVLNLMQSTHATEAEAFLKHAREANNALEKERAITKAGVHATLAVASEVSRATDALEELVRLFRGPNDLPRVETAGF